MSLPSALASITLSVSLALGSHVAFASPEPTEPAPTDGQTTDTGASEAQKLEAEGLSEKAIGEFSAKNYTGAVALFEQAYALDPQPNYLFNIGRVYEEAGDLERAVEYYAKFVKQPGVEIDSREVALDRLKVLRAILEETQEPEEEPEPEPEPVVPVVTQPEPEQVDTASERKSKALRISGFTLVGVGAGALIGGAIVGSLAQSDNDKANDRDEADSLAARQDLLDKSQTKALTADVLFGVGGALLLTGVVLLAVGYAKPKTKRVALTPSFGPQHGGWGGGVDLRLQF